MKTKVFTTIFLLIILLFVFFLIYLKFYSEEKNSTHIFADNTIEVYDKTCGEYKTAEVKLGAQTLPVNIADTECKRNLGLSWRTSLVNEGMIFIFDKVGNYAFWMKDMNFPIDILWINSDFTISGIEKNVLPSTYPQSFGSKFKAMYVLEIPAGYSTKNNIKVGDKILYK